MFNFTCFYQEFGLTLRQTLFHSDCLFVKNNVLNLITNSNCSLAMTSMKCCLVYSGKPKYIPSVCIWLDQRKVQTPTDI